MDGELTRSDVARVLGRDYTTIKRWEREGRLKVSRYVETGKTRSPRFSEDDVEDLRVELGVATMDEGLLHENDMLRAEINRLRDDLKRERSLVDRLLGAELDYVKSRARLMGGDDGG